ncbi:MAG: FtsX-like permease family protein [Deltaproteobacteria bacterium]|nr:MAG: FtsX-like permease family protein [Deltaproteobacteria bacterium]
MAGAARAPRPRRARSRHAAARCAVRHPRSHRQPRIHRGHPSHADARDRGQHGDLQRHRRGPTAAVAVRPRTPDGPPAPAIAGRPGGERRLLAARGEGLPGADPRSRRGGRVPPDAVHAAGRRRGAARLHRRGLGELLRRFRRPPAARQDVRGGRRRAGRCPRPRPDVRVLAARVPRRSGGRGQDLHHERQGPPGRRSAGAHPQARTPRGLTVFGRLRSGATLATAQKDLAQISERLHTAYPHAYPKSEGFLTTAASLRDELTRGARPTLIVLLATTLFLLVIVCANVANLTMARLVRREKEMAVRTALGATRLRLLQLLLTENLILAIAGGVLGVLVASWGLDALAAFAARFTTRASEIRLDGRVLLFALGLSLFTGTLLGCLPALPARANLAADLKEGAGATAHRARLRARSALIVSQVAVSFALLIGAGLMLRSLLNLQSVDAGFDVENVLTARVDLNWSRSGRPEQIRTFGDGLLDRIRVEPGVISAALTGSVPLNDTNPFGVEFQIEGAPPSDGPRPRADLETATPDLFQTMGVPLLAGRAFTAMDRDPAPPVAIVNQSFARHFFPGEDALGKRIKVVGATNWVQIVGVVADVKQHGLEREPGNELYAPFAIQPFLDLRLIVRSRAPAADVERMVRGTIKEMDPQQPVTEVRTLAQVRADNLASPRLTALLLGAFAILAIFITAAGIAGVIAYSVSQRTQEIGIRLALGAAPSSLLAMVVRQGMALVGLGLALGILGGLAISRVMSGLVFGIAAHDPVTYVAGAAVLAGVGAVACLVPARRIAEVDPMIALRSA